MRLTIVHGAVLGAALALSACGDSPAPASTVAAAAELPFDSLFVPVGEVRLRTDAANAVGFVASMALNPSRVFIADPARSDIKVFHRRSGLLLGAIGVPGDGPGRLMTPSTLTLASVNRLVVSDLGRNVVSVWDTNGFLGYENRNAGAYADFTPIPGTTRVLAGGYYSATGEAQFDSLGRRPQVHEVDYMTGELVTSYIMKAPPSGHPWARVYATPRATLVGNTAVAGMMSSNVLWLHDRTTGKEREMSLSAPWYRPPAFPADTSAAVETEAAIQAMDQWAQQQYMLSAILPLSGARFVVEFVTGGDATGRRYHYIVADTAGQSLFSTQDSDVRLLVVQDTLAHGIRTEQGTTSLVSYRIRADLLN